MSTLPVETTTESPATASRSDSWYHLSIFLAAALVFPALVLVADGNLSVDAALVRFACALVAAVGAVTAARLWLPLGASAPSAPSEAPVGAAGSPGG